MIAPQSPTGIEQRAILGALYWARHISETVDQACLDTPALAPLRRSDGALSMTGTTKSGGTVAFRILDHELLMFRAETIIDGDYRAIRTTELSLLLPARMHAAPFPPSSEPPPAEPQPELVPA
jgi:hypothetical protein